MSRRYKPRSDKGHPKHRLIPVWQPELDRQGLARTLLLLAQHLDDQQHAEAKPPPDRPNRDDTDPTSERRKSP